VSEIQELEIIYVNTSAIVANYMTKPVGPNKFAYILAILGLATKGVI